MRNDFWLKILAEFTLHMCVDIVVSFVWLDYKYWPIWYMWKMLSRVYDDFVSRIEKYIVMIILLWDIDLKDNLIVKLFVFFVFYYFDDIIFKYWKNKCIYE